MYRPLKDSALKWLFQWRGPERGAIVLVQRRVFILPTPQGLLFVGIILLMLIGSINYDLSLGFILSFLLGAAGIQSMLHTFRNLAHLKISAGRVAPVFAGEQAQFSMHIHNQTRADRFSIGVTGDRINAHYVDVPSGSAAVAVVAIPALRRGWLSPGRLTLYTRFPVGLFRAWSYAEPDVQCLVYPAPAIPGLPLPQQVAGDGEGGIKGQGQDEFSGFRPYRPGDSPRHVAWKAVARDDSLLTKQFTGRADAELWLSWNDLPNGMDTEPRLSHLTRWVLDADNCGLNYGLRLPGATLPPANGPTHRADCLRALALHGTTADIPQ
jgi:uncharacterized protein (DUF58 family)